MPKRKGKYTSSADMSTRSMNSWSESRYDSHLYGGERIYESEYEYSDRSIYKSDWVDYKRIPYSSRRHSSWASSGSGEDGRPIFYSIRMVKWRIWR